MKVLVTGGAGYIGSHCVKLLCERSHQVVVLDDLSAGHAAAVHRKAVLIRADVADRSALGSLLAEHRVDGVIHLAGHLNVSESVAQPLKYYENNVAKTVVLLQHMKQAGVRRIVFSSTCATYGVPQKLPITEEHPQNPVTPYGRSKLTVEHMLRDCGSAWGLAAVALRYFNASGCAADGTLGEDHDPEIHLIPRGLLAAMGRLDGFKIYGTDYPTPDGTCIRDYVHVDDLAAAHLLALEAAEPGVMRAYNCGIGRGYSVREVLDTIGRVIGRSMSVGEADRRPGDPPELYADAGKLRSELGWHPQFEDIDDIVQTAWRWFAAHPNGYDAVGPRSQSSA
ncbi:MAG TPA: UDP-glucose 4-epimerase GalE [Phycisphaerae bacterium]|nr:UDP-glucose 4-epimerase GalE [Phycisphaerae bacterium]